MKVGFVGCPPEDVLSKYRTEELFDLDNFYPASRQTDLLPPNTCAIVKRIVANALSLKPELIVFDEGYGKCDMARSAADVILKNMDVEMIRTRNNNLEPNGTRISDSRLGLKEKVELIVGELDGTAKRPDGLKAASPSPPVAFWGVPASDFSIYDLFPAGTKVLGWTRCLENRTPDNPELESFVDERVPTVFFAQTFCHKNILAKNLAAKYNGLYVDMDGHLTGSSRAKIEAFLRFNI